MNARVSQQTIRVAIVYFAFAFIALRLTRYDGGVAFLWPATPYLVAEFNSVSRRNWGILAFSAGMASVLATGFFGFGWQSAAPMAVANVAEAIIAAYFIRRRMQGSALNDLGWFVRFLSLGVVLPSIVSSCIAALVAAALNHGLVASYFRFFVGHALSNLTFAPVFILLFSGELLGFARQIREKRVECVALISLSFAATAACFLQSSYPLLFLPVMPIILATFRLGRGGTIICILFLAIFGGAATLAQLGPLQLVGTDAGTRVQIFQFYLAMTVLTAWPVAADLSQRSRLHRNLRQSEERYRMIAEHSSDILMQISADGIIRYVSPSVETLGGYSPDNLLGKRALDLVDSAYRPQTRALHSATLRNPQQTHALEYLAVRADGTSRWFETHTRAIFDDRGLVDGVLSIARDITERKNAQDELSRAAFTDALTGLPNRRGWNAELEKRFALRASRSRRNCLAVIDIDHFKRVNDGFGHDAGDSVLQHFSRLAQSEMRSNDFIARIGGEEFVIFFEDTTLLEARSLCERLREKVAGERLRFREANIAITISGGVAPLEGSDVEKAMRMADAALYAAKQGGRDRLALAA